MALHHKNSSYFCVKLFKNILDEEKVQILQLSTDLASWSQTEYEHEHIPQTVQRITQWNCRHDQGRGHRQNWPRAPAWLTENTSGWGWGTVYRYFIVLEKYMLQCIGGMINILLNLLNIKLINVYKIYKNRQLLFVSLSINTKWNTKLFFYLSITQLNWCILFLLQKGHNAKRVWRW